MGENVPVRCPACRRQHSFTAPVFPCACGEPLAPPLLRGAAPERITHRTWTDTWVAAPAARAGARTSGRSPNWGVRAVRCSAYRYAPCRAPPHRRGPHRRRARRRPPPGPDRPPLPPSLSVPRPAAAGRGSPASEVPSDDDQDRVDAVTAAALYLKWLGFRDIMQSPERPASGIDLRAPGLVAQVDPTTCPATLRDVECLWLNGLSASAVSVFFSLAGYADDARAGADTLGVPLFVMDLTGTPQPVNRPADELVSTGAGA